MLKFTEREAAATGEIILGFITDDVDALYERVLAAGGGVHAPVRDDEGAPYRVGFVKDPEGHLAEVVQLLDQ